jgi:hypothetical protein
MYENGPYLEKGKTEAGPAEEPGQNSLPSCFDECGIQLFREACKFDLEGIVAKRKDAPYPSDERHSSWVNQESGLQPAQGQARIVYFAS